MNTDIIMHWKYGASCCVNFIAIANLKRTVLFGYQEYEETELIEKGEQELMILL